MATEFDYSKVVEVGEIPLYRTAFGRTRRLWCERFTDAKGEAFYLFRGGRTGEHAISAHPLITPVDRLLAHWEGYCENNGMGLREGTRVLIDTSNAWRDVTVLSTPRPDSKTVLVSGFTYKHGGKAKPRRVAIKQVVWPLR